MDLARGLYSRGARRSSRGGHHGGCTQVVVIVLGTGLSITAVNCLELSWTDLRSEHGAEAIILHSVLRALPLLVLAFTAS